MAISYWHYSYARRIITTDVSKKPERKRRTICVRLLLSVRVLAQSKIIPKCCEIGDEAHNTVAFTPISIMGMLFKLVDRTRSTTSEPLHLTRMPNKEHTLYDSLPALLLCPSSAPFTCSSFFVLRLLNATTCFS